MENSILSLFSLAAKQYPDKIALHYFSEKLNYKQLDNLSNKVAGMLINRNILRNSPILIEVEKSLATVVYLLGILKAGCYYIPVTSNIPINRLNYLLENSQCGMAFLSHYYDQLHIKNGLTCILMEKDLSKFEKSRDIDVSYITSLIKPDDPVCCLYTSGSTGHPKGVLMSHVGFSTFFEEIKPIMNMNHNAICLNTAPFIFDVSIIDVFFPLVMGATVVISPEIILPNMTLKMIHQHRITHMCGVSSTINLLFGNAELLANYDISSLITVMTGAELLHQKTLLTLLSHAPSVTIINGYGLTETTCVVLAFTINGHNVNDYFLYPIGKPLPSVGVKILTTDDSEDNRGELLLSGDQIMLEYLNNPEANSKVFVEYEGKRYLKTGDIVSYDKDRNIIFHGRNDTQVKINGYRIDLNEVKYNILSIQIVKEAEVFIANSMIAVVLSLHSKPVNEKEKVRVIDNVKESLNDLLPKYMHPKKWLILEDLPKLSTGKSDLKKIRTCFDN